eukprot:TRINITY_DN41_c0_g1_i1.p3 TRINITY_DN41_c0_g1~~TRINITY_DN41_c0_g1_i1.p3  ORF type:complete len:176 (+),score=20.73 TRINITY_DN41_c0_g1_i1:414-941(+)
MSVVVLAPLVPSAIQQRVAGLPDWQTSITKEPSSLASQNAQRSLKPPLLALASNVKPSPNPAPINVCSGIDTNQKAVFQPHNSCAPHSAFVEQLLPGTTNRDEVSNVRYLPEELLRQMGVPCLPGFPIQELSVYDKQPAEAKDAQPNTTTRAKMLATLNIVSKILESINQKLILQ